MEFDGIRLEFTGFRIKVLVQTTDNLWVEVIDVENTVPGGQLSGDPVIVDRRAIEVARLSAAMRPTAADLVCPHCHGAIVARERRPNGFVTCERNHQSRANSLVDRRTLPGYAPPAAPAPVASESLGLVDDILARARAQGIGMAAFPLDDIEAVLRLVRPSGPTISGGGGSPVEVYERLAKIGDVVLK